MLLFELLAGYPVFCADEPIKVEYVVEPTMPLSEAEAAAFAPAMPRSPSSPRGW